MFCLCLCLCVFNYMEQFWMDRKNKPQQKAGQTTEGQNETEGSRSSSPQSSSPQVQREAVVPTGAEIHRVPESTHEGAESTHSTDKLGHCCCIWRRRRYYIAIMAFLGYVMSYSTRVNLSVAIVFIVEAQTEPWSESLQGNILASFFYGYIVTQIPAGYLCGVMGGHHVMNLGVAGSGFVSFLMPLAAGTAPWAVIVVRTICGLFQGLMIPAMVGVWARWAPPLERTILQGIAMSGNFFAAILVMPLCSLIGRYLGWEWIFHIFSMLSLLWSLLWLCTVFAGPEKDRCIKDSERLYIEQAIGERTNAQPRHPWKRLLLSCPVWVFVLVYMGHNWGFYTVMVYGPKFFHGTMGYTLDFATILTGVCFMVCGVTIQLFGWTSDFLRSKYLSTLTVRKIFTCTGFFLQGAAFLLAVVAPWNEVITAAIVLGIALDGISFSGFSVVPLDIAPPHAALIMGLGNTLGTLPGILMPIYTGQILTDDPQPHDWDYIWASCVAAYFSCVVLFAFFAKAERQSWVYTPPPRNSI